MTYLDHEVLLAVDHPPVLPALDCLASLSPISGTGRVEGAGRNKKKVKTKVVGIRCADASKESFLAKPLRATGFSQRILVVFKVTR